MRIVFVNRIAWPDEGATAIYLTDVAEACAAAGHEVHVVCGAAAYRGSTGAAEPDAVHEAVRYHRLPGARGRGLWRRGAASLRFLVRARRRLRAFPRPDVVVALTDPPFLDVAVGPVARRAGARVVHWLMDVYPEVAVAAGVLRPRTPLHGVLRRAAGKALRRADAVVVLGRAMRRPALARGVARARLRVVENWAPRPVEEAPRDGPTPPASPVTLLYSGNLGRAHDLEPLARAARALDPGAPVRLVFQAGGARLEETRSLFADVRVPVEWRPPVPLGALAGALREAHWHVVSVRSGFERLLVPSKTYAPLALGLPLIVLGPGRSEPARLVRRLGCGLVWSHDEDAVAGLRALARGGAAAPSRRAPWRRRDAGRRAWVDLLEEVGRRAPS